MMRRGHTVSLFVIPPRPQGYIYIYIYIYYYYIYLLYFNQFPPLWGRHTSCHEMSESRRLLKLKDMKREIFTFILLSCRFDHRWIFTLPVLHKAVASQGQGFIPQAMPHAFPLTNPHHTPLLCTILLACLTSKPLFFKQSFMVSVHLFYGLPTE